jgi:hypothetical protein
MTDFSEAGTRDQGLATPATKTYRWGPRQGLENRDYWMDCEAAF